MDTVKHQALIYQECQICVDYFTNKSFEH